MTSAKECSKDGCGKLASFGSRCARHWLQRQSAFAKLPTKQLWWRIIEPTLVAGLEMRRLVMLRTGDARPPITPFLDSHLTPRRRARWGSLIEEIVARADDTIEKEMIENEHPVRSEEDRR